MANTTDKNEPGISLESLRSMFSRKDGYMKALGIDIIDIGPGTASVRMVVGTEHLNFNGSCHGGCIFSLADCAFGVSSNTHGVMAAGIDAHITYQAAAYPGEILTAHSREISRSRKIATYQIEVESDKNGLITSFTGTVYIIGKSHSAEAG